MKIKSLSFITTLLIVIVGYSQNLFIAKNKKGFYGIIDSVNNIILPFEYKEIKNDYDYVIAIDSENNYGMFNKKLDKILDCEYDTLIYDCSSYIITKKRKWGMADIEGKNIIPNKFDAISFVMRDGDTSYVAVKRNNKIKALDLHRKIIKDLELNEEMFFAHLCAIEQDFDFLVYIGSEIIEKDDKFGVYDEDNDNWIIENKFDKIYNSGKGYEVYLNNKVGFYSKSGEELISPEYDKLKKVGDYFIATKNGQKGVLYNDKTLISPRYEYLKLIR